MAMKFVFDVIRGNYSTTRFSGFMMHLVKDAHYEKQAVVAAQKYFGSLCYGSEKPTRILSSKAVCDNIRKCIVSREIVEVKHGNREGFWFNGAMWLNDDSLEDSSWIVMINYNQPENYKFNGCYEFNGGRHGSSNDLGECRPQSGIREVGSQV
jgi:hypothetical protein